MVNKNVLSCLLKDGKEVNAVMLVGRLVHARATVTRNDRSPMVLSRVRGTIRRGQEPDRSHLKVHTSQNLLQEVISGKLQFFRHISHDSDIRIGTTSNQEYG